MTMSMIVILSIAILAAISLLMRGKLKIVKYTLWAINIIMALFFFMIMLINRYYDNKESKYLIGPYSLDIKNSKFRNTDLSQFNSLVLTVKDDHTFAFNATTPFFTKNKGSWTYHIDGDAGFIKCRLEDAELYYLIMENDSGLIFEKDILKNASLGDRIVFKRDKSN